MVGYRRLNLGVKTAIGRAVYFLLSVFLMFALGACSQKNDVTEPIPVTTHSESSSAGLETTSAGVTEQPVSDEIAVSFMGIGDNLIHPNIYEYADAIAGSAGDGEYDFAHFFENIRSYIDGADIAFINQETLSGGDEQGLRGYPNFNTPRAIIKQIESAGFDLVGMANNHVLDCGISGIYHALYNWAKTECVISGINADEDMRSEIPVLERGGLKFAFLAYTSHTNGISADTDWRVNYMEEEAIMRDVAKAREIADFVIVSAHWGWDDVFDIDGYQMEFAQVFANANVDLVVGTGPHVLQHIQWFDRADGKKMLCAFSLGNYCSGMIGPFNELGGILTLDFVVRGDEKSIENAFFVPTVMHKEEGGDMGVYLLGEYTDAQVERSLVNIYSGGLTLDYLREVLHEQIDDEFLAEEFRR